MGMGVHKSAIIPAGYPYNHHLLEFERRSGAMAGVSHPWLQRVSSPLRHSEWSCELEGHPDTVLATYVLNGIYNGFHIGFDRSKRCKPSRSNMKTALDNAGVVGQYLEEEMRLGRIVGPIPLAWVPAGTQLSPIGVIPKSNQPSKWRLIVDLSSPHGQSVNDGIEPHLCTVEYLRMDEVLGRIAASGRGTQLAKMDIASAYRMVTGAFRRQAPPGCSVGWPGVLRHEAAIWLEVSS